MSTVLLIGEAVKPLSEGITRGDSGSDTVEWVETGSEALSTLSVEEFDYVIGSTNLPDLDAVALMRRLREHNPDLLAILVADDSRSLSTDGHLSTMSGIEVIAPGDDNDLVIRIREFIDEQTIESSLRRYQSLRSIVAEITQSLFDVSNRSEMEHIVCRRLVASNMYAASWMYEYDNESDILVPSASSGIELDMLSTRQVPIDIAAGGEVVVSATNASNGVTTFDVSILDRDRFYGVLTLVRRGEIDQGERTLLLDLGRVITRSLENIEPTSKSELSAESLCKVITHEFRNHLQNATMSFTLVQEGVDEDDYAESLQDSLDRMSHRLDQISALGRSQLGELERQELSETATAAWEQVDGGDGSFTVEDSDPIVAHHLLLEVLFENLFRNSIEHGDQANVRVGLLEDGFYVEDDGAGISPEIHDTVFEWGFSTVDNGTGVGLALVKHVVDLHGWTITVTESSSGGARFEITGV